MSNHPPRGFSREEASAIVRKINSELSPEEQDLLNEAGKKMRFWTNVGVLVGFMSFSLPIATRRHIRYRFLKGLFSGTLGICIVTPFTMLYGAQRASATIKAHPNHEHLLKVLQETRKVMAGRNFGGDQSNELPPDQQQSQSWPAEQQQTFPSTTAESTFDEDSLLTDEEIAKQNKGATFTPPSQGNTRSSAQSAGAERPRSAWDELRAKAERNKPQQAQPEKEESVWGDDK